MAARESHCAQAAEEIADAFRDRGAAAEPGSGTIMSHASLETSDIDVSRAHRSRCHHARVEAAHAPAWGSVIALLHFPVVDFELERFTVDIERRSTGPRGWVISSRAPPARNWSPMRSWRISMPRVVRFSPMRAEEERISAGRARRRRLPTAMRRMAFIGPPWMPGCACRSPSMPSGEIQPSAIGTLGKPARRDIDLHDSALHKPFYERSLPS